CRWDIHVVNVHDRLSVYLGDKMLAPRNDFQREPIVRLSDNVCSALVTVLSLRAKPPQTPRAAIWRHGIADVAFVTQWLLSRAVQCLEIEKRRWRAAEMDAAIASGIDFGLATQVEIGEIATIGIQMTDRTRT